MTTNRTPMKGMDNRQKIIAAVFVVILLIIIWQAYGLIGGGGSVSPTPAANQTGRTAAPVATTTVVVSAKPSQAEMTPQERQLMRDQEENQARYLTAVNQLQLLKITKDIADLNQSISSARLNTVENQRKILEMVNPPAPAPTTFTKITTTTGDLGANVSYTVISVSKLKNQWNAVLNQRGNLYTVQVNDVLPPDGSKVIAIDKTGVTLLKGGETRKLSMVPII